MRFTAEVCLRSNTSLTRRKTLLHVGYLVSKALQGFTHTSLTRDVNTGKYRIP